MKGKLILEDGQVFDGFLFGKDTNIEGEIVFNTSMVGYPESLTDPSYKNQILVLTYPSIGNYGVPPQHINSVTNLLDFFESDKIQISGLIISDYCDNHSHWNSNKTLSNWMVESSIPGLHGIDTRKLTKIIRDRGTMKAKIIFDEEIPLLTIPNNDLVALVSRNDVKEYNTDGKYKIIAIDCGIKNNIIRKLLSYKDIHLKVVPYNYKIEENTPEEKLYKYFLVPKKWI